MKSIIYSLEYLRYYTYWLVDFLSGNRIQKNINDISFTLNHFSSAKSIKQREKNLNNILEHALNTVPYYKHQKNAQELTDFNVINKNIIVNKSSEFQSNLYKNRKNKTVLTSGSTGVRFKIIQNKKKQIRNTADTLFFSKKANFKVGNKLIFIRLWDKYMRKNPVINFIKNIQAENILDLNNSNILKLVKSLEQDASHKNFLAYASGLEQICLCLDKHNYTPKNLNIQSAIAISESLNTYTKKRFKKYFNCPVISRYSNTENGIIAQQNIGENQNFQINWASYYVEILNFDNNLPVKNNELGRLVITDLFNYAMPLIRYDTGDVGAINYNVSPPVLTKIEGRKGDIIFNTKGEIVTKFVAVCFIPYKNILQGQVIQENKNSYTLKLNVTKNFNKEEILIKEFKSYLGEDANISVKYVSEIPVLSSGKRRITVNNYIK